MFMTPVSSVFAQKAVDNREITVMAERDAKDDAEESGTFLWWCGGFLLTFLNPVQIHFASQNLQQVVSALFYPTSNCPLSDNPFPSS